MRCPASRQHSTSMSNVANAAGVGILAFDEQTAPIDPSVSEVGTLTRFDVIALRAELDWLDEIEFPRGTFSYLSTPPRIHFVAIRHGAGAGLRSRCSDRRQRGLTFMRSIALFLLSSILTPATLAAGQATCLLATETKVMTPLPGDNSITGRTAISNSGGSCVARPAGARLRPVAAWQTTGAPQTMTESNAAIVMEILLEKLGWTNLDESVVSAAPAALRVNYGHARGSKVPAGVESSLNSFAAAPNGNVVVWF